MADENYKVDKLAIIQEQEERAANEVAIIEQRCELSPVSFLKENYNFKKLRERKTEPEIRILIGTAMVKSAGHIGIKSIDPLNRSDISKMILSTYNDLTLEEIYKSFELERYGVYEDKTEHFQLFNSEYVAAVLKKYRNWKQNTKIQHNISPPVALPQQTDSDKKEIITNGIVRVFNEFKDSGIMPEPNNYIFDELLERKIIREPVTEGEVKYYARKKIQAEEEIKSELRPQKETFDNVAKKRVKEELDKIIHGNSDKVVARLKKLVLTDYFTRLIKENKSIEQILQENERDS